MGLSVYPGRCPGLCKYWAFSPSLRKRYWSRLCANVIGHVLAQTLLVSRPCNSMWLPLPNFLYSHPCFIRFPPYLIVFASRFLLCHLFGMRSGCVRDDCWLFILVVIPYIFILVISCAPQRGNFSTAQGIAMGIRML